MCHISIIDYLMDILFYTIASLQYLNLQYITSNHNYLLSIP